MSIFKEKGEDPGGTARYYAKGGLGNGALASVHLLVRVAGTQVRTTPYLEEACKKYNGLPAPE